MEATVGEIHAYPLRPEGYAEPLFRTARSRRQILEHLARSSWLWRASEAPRPLRGAASATAQENGKVIASWREVDRWWEPDGGVDRVCYLRRTRCGREEVHTVPQRQP